MGKHPNVPCPFANMSTPTASARVFLVRHGETDWMTGGKFASRTDIPLSKMGERDVELIRERLVAENETIDPTGVAKMLVHYTGRLRHKKAATPKHTTL
jgi:bisphosphoglycerate-dependent phosphoglycerate mutase